MDYSPTEYLVTYRCGHQAVIDLAETYEVDHDQAKVWEEMRHRCQDCDRSKQATNPQTGEFNEDMASVYEMEDVLGLSRLYGPPIECSVGAAKRLELYARANRRFLHTDEINDAEWEEQYGRAFMMIRDAKWWDAMDMSIIDRLDELHELINLEAPLHPVQLTSKVLFGPTMDIPYDQHLML